MSRITVGEFIQKVVNARSNLRMDDEISVHYYGEKELEDIVLNHDGTIAILIDDIDEEDD